MIENGTILSVRIHTPKLKYQHWTTFPPLMLTRAENKSQAWDSSDKMVQ